MPKLISIGADHAGFDLKQDIIAHLQQMGYEVLDHGTHSHASVDYPDYSHPVAQDIVDRKSELGILICGSGNGVAIAANKHNNVRCALCWNVELAGLARNHNDANIISIPARFVSVPLALEMVDTFLSTSFEGGRHANRVDKINV